MDLRIPMSKLEANKRLLGFGQLMSMRSSGSGNLAFSDANEANCELMTCRKFKKEKDSYESCKEFALNSLTYVPENTKWRVYLELADLEKRNNFIVEVRYLF